MGARPLRWESGDCRLEALLYRRFPGFVRLSLFKSNMYMKIRTLRLWNGSDRENRNGVEKNQPRATLSTLKSHGLTEDRTRASAVRSRWLKWIYVVYVQFVTHRNRSPWRLEKKNSQWVLYREIISVVRIIQWECINKLCKQNAEF